VLAAAWPSWPLSRRVVIPAERDDDEHEACGVGVAHFGRRRRAADGFAAGRASVDLAGLSSAGGVVQLVAVIGTFMVVAAPMVLMALRSRGAGPAADPPSAVPFNTIHLFPLIAFAVSRLAFAVALVALIWFRGPTWGIIPAVIGLVAMNAFNVSSRRRTLPTSTDQ
jgi:hypothetical protein